MNRRRKCKKKRKKKRKKEQTKKKKKKAGHHNGNIPFNPYFPIKISKPQYNSAAVRDMDQPKSNAKIWCMLQTTWFLSISIFSST